MFECVEQCVIQSGKSLHIENTLDKGIVFGPKRVSQRRCSLLMDEAAGGIVVVDEAVTVVCEARENAGRENRQAGKQIPKRGAPARASVPTKAPSADVSRRNDRHEPRAYQNGWSYLPKPSCRTKKRMRTTSRPKVPPREKS